MKNYGLLLLLAFLAVGTASAEEWRPSRTLLRAIRSVESSSGRRLVGDDGASLGEFQLSEAAWLDVNSWRKARSLKTYPYRKHVFNAFISRVYASDYLTILYGELSSKLDRPPTSGELYAAYNLGLACFGSCNFELHRVNPVTRERCRRIDRLLAER